MRTPDGDDASAEHTLGIYDTDALLIATVVDFVRPALAGEAMAIAVLPSAIHGAVADGLAAEGIDVEAARGLGDLVLADADVLVEGLMAGGVLDLDGYRAISRQLLTAAAARGSELRICGNLHSVLWEAGEIEALLELEGLWNRSTGVPPVRLLCLYAAHVFDRFARQAGHDPFVALCEEHVRVRPVEDDASFIAALGQQRAAAPPDGVRP